MTRYSRFALGCVLVNTACWLSFLLRDPLPAADIAQRELDFSSAAPRIVAGRPVWPHGDALLDVYQIASLPGVVAGRAAYELAVDGVSAVADESPSTAVILFGSPQSRSWVLAGIVFACTSVHWAVIGVLLGVATARVRGRGRNAGQQGADEHRMA